MNLEITPEPDAQERLAIEAVLAGDADRPGRDGAWAEAALPRRDDEEPGDP